MRKSNKKEQPWKRLLLSILRGAWRIRTAVDGFADRRLSHSSKAPCSEPFVFASAKIQHLLVFAKYLEAKF